MKIKQSIAMDLLIAFIMIATPFFMTFVFVILQAISWRWFLAHPVFWILALMLIVRKRPYVVLHDESIETFNPDGSHDNSINYSDVIEIRREERLVRYTSGPGSNNVEIVFVIESESNEIELNLFAYGRNSIQLIISKIEANAPMMAN